MEMINAKELVYSYDFEGSERRSLDGISLTVQRGELVAVLGHNGCGKTTLARHLNALLPMQGGQRRARRKPRLADTKELRHGVSKPG